MKSKFIAISGISATFVAIILTFGAAIELFDLVSILLSSIFVILPLYIKSYKGCFLCYLVGGVVAFILTLGVGQITSVVFPAYFAFFGIYPIVKFIALEKGFNKKVFMLLGAIWCIGASYLMFFYYTALTGALDLNGIPQFIVDNIIYFVGLLGLVFFFLYDRFLVVTKFLEDKYLKRIIK